MTQARGPSRAPERGESARRPPGAELQSWWRSTRWEHARVDRIQLNRQPNWQIRPAPRTRTRGTRARVELVRRDSAPALAPGPTRATGHQQDERSRRDFRSCNREESDHRRISPIRIEEASSSCIAAISSRSSPTVTVSSSSSSPSSALPSCRSSSCSWSSACRG